MVVALALAVVLVVVVGIAAAAVAPATCHEFDEGRSIQINCKILCILCTYLSKYYAFKRLCWHMYAYEYLRVYGR